MWRKEEGKKREKGKKESKENYSTAFQLENISLHTAKLRENLVIGFYFQIHK